MDTKEPAVIEQAINRLKAVVTENRILSHEIADNVFHDRPEGVGANSPEPVVLLLPEAPAMTEAAIVR